MTAEAAYAKIPNKESKAAPRWNPTDAAQCSQPHQLVQQYEMATTPISIWLRNIAVIDVFIGHRCSDLVRMLQENVFETTQVIQLKVVDGKTVPHTGAYINLPKSSVVGCAWETIWKVRPTGKYVFLSSTAYLEKEELRLRAAKLLAAVRSEMRRTSLHDPGPTPQWPFSNGTRGHARRRHPQVLDTYRTGGSSQIFGRRSLLDAPPKCPATHSESSGTCRQTKSTTGHDAFYPIPYSGQADYHEAPVANVQKVSRSI